MNGGIVGAVRRNHALEHGTVSILLAKLGPDVRLAGRAVADGFYIYGKIPTDAITSSAREALLRLKAGEAGLAVTPLCGTNIAVAGVLTGLASMMALGSSRRRFERLPTVFTAAMFGVLASQPIGRLVQKHITTSPDLDRAEITGVHSTARGFVHKVETSFDA
ncbi:MAG TPA: DUF6391 domain-containing protein [Dehalococcoidia bacterium]|nr:DUF6391 domain-containing protein [Dehalococcoidia bacterium]